jgi:hypothetical protein
MLRTHDCADALLLYMLLMLNNTVHMQLFITQQSQGVWWQDFPLKADTSRCAGTNTQFGPALIDYLRCTAGLRHSADTTTIAAMPTAQKLANLAPAAANLIHLTERLEHNYDLSAASVVLTAR